MRQIYPFKKLLPAVTQKYKNRFEKQLEKEMSAFFLKAKTTPDDLFTFLDLDQIGATANIFMKPNFPYWLRYCTLYNFNAKEKVDIFPILFEYFDKEWILRSFKSFDSTEDLKSEMKDAGFASYIK